MPRLSKKLRFGHTPVSLDALQLFEILVPTTDSDGVVTTARKHETWLAAAKSLGAKGIVLMPASLPWSIVDEHLVSARLIPFRIVCTRSQVRKIANMTAVYFNQAATMVYRVSDDVAIYHMRGF